MRIKQHNTHTHTHTHTLTHISEPHDQIHQLLPDFFLCPEKFHVYPAFFFLLLSSADSFQFLLHTHTRTRTHTHTHTAHLFPHLLSVTVACWVHGEKRMNHHIIPRWLCTDGFITVALFRPAAEPRPRLSSSFWWSSVTLETCSEVQFIFKHLRRKWKTNTCPVLEWFLDLVCLFTDDNTDTQTFPVSLTDGVRKVVFMSLHIFNF